MLISSRRFYRHWYKHSGQFRAQAPGREAAPDLVRLLDMLTAPVQPQRGQRAEQANSLRF
jgi:hypothetical protein